MDEGAMAQNMNEGAIARNFAADLQFQRCKEEMKLELNRHKNETPDIIDQELGPGNLDKATTNAAQMLENFPRKASVKALLKDVDLHISMAPVYLEGGDQISIKYDIHKVVLEMAAMTHLNLKLHYLTFKNPPVLVPVSTC